MRKPALSIALGRAIRSAREKAGVSQEALAAEANLHRTYLGMVERAERNITVLSLAQIAEALGVTASSLLTQAEASRTRSR